MLSPLFCEGITNLSKDGNVILFNKSFEPDDIKITQSLSLQQMTHQLTHLFLQ